MVYRASPAARITFGNVNESGQMKQQEIARLGKTFSAICVASALNENKPSTCREKMRIGRLTAIMVTYVISINFFA